MEEKVLLQVLAEQKEDVAGYDYSKWCSRREESLFEWNSGMAQVVTGVRRSGKSTLCHKVLLEHHVVYGYADLNDDRLSKLKTEDLNTLLGCIYQLYGTEVQYIFLDEIQDVEGWHLFVNRLLRQGKHVFLTGSNSRLLSSELTTYLTGRYNEIRLYPFSFAEICNFMHIDQKGITTKADAARKAAMTRYLNEGGLPELINLQNPQNRRIYCESLIETIITKDISRRYRIRQIEGLRRIAHHLINNICQSISYDGLAELANLSSTATSQKYTAYLTQAFLVHRVQKFSFKSRERISCEKGYVVDMGFVANRDNNLLGENLGWRLENAVCIELLRRYHSMAEDIYYYKPTSRSKEVDFVICRQGKVLELVQVAYSIHEPKTLKRETDALIQASQKLACENLTLISLDESKDLNLGGYVIHQRSAIDWFLNNQNS